MHQPGFSSLFHHTKNILIIENHEASNRSNRTVLHVPRLSQDQTAEYILELFCNSGIFNLL
jgi:hypothetical protein